MNIEKKVIGTLEKCYSLMLLEYEGNTHILVAAEKINQCRMYDMCGNLEEVLWEKPGGVMSMVPVPDGGGQFLATWKFYSPNDSKDASIVCVTPRGGRWEVKTLCRLPFVHRFDILQKGGRNYLLACTLKSGHNYREDWTNPGKVYGAELPRDLTAVDEEHPLDLHILKEQMYRNHGYFRDVDADGMSSVVACEQGIFRFVPPDPAQGKNDWTVKQMLDIPASDCVLLDLDGCGDKEMLVFSPFHGDTVSIYKVLDGVYRKIYEHPQKLEFLHAVCCGRLDGKPAVFIGYRRGARELMAVTSDGKGGFWFDLVDRNCGPANVLFYENEGGAYLLSANREINEIALYTLKDKG